MTIQQEATTLINAMSDDNVKVIVELLRRMIPSSSIATGEVKANQAGINTQKRRLGLAEGKFVIPDNIDACNDEIAQMFGVES